MTASVITIESLVNRFGTKTVHDGINLEVHRGEIIAIVGGSGSGKTTLLHSILMLRRPTSGHIRLLGVDTLAATEQELMRVRRRLGVTFQYNALFTSLNILENIRFPLDEFTHLSKKIKRHLALMKLKMVGLELDAALKYPSELSGGMQKRAALARALALEPDLLFLDEPTSGLDPINARKFDKLVQKLREMLGLTIVMVTHDKASLEIADRVIFIGQGRVIADEPVEQLMKNPHPDIQDYLTVGNIGGK